MDSEIKGRSADLAILTLTEKIYESVEKDEFLIGIFLDLSKAFDTLSHTILLNKLSYYGFRGIANDWIANYLTSRNPVNITIPARYLNVPF